MIVRFLKLHPDAVVPKYQTAGAAAMDLVVVESGFILPGHARTFPIGLSFEVPAGHVMLIFSRSGHGFKNGIRLCNTTGVIDSDYRGEIKVRLHNDSEYQFSVTAGDRVAQAMILPVPAIELVEASLLSFTERGAHGYGSTGA